jgi:hypothetical protein
MRTTGEQADKIKDEVASLRNAAAAGLSEAEERLRAAAAEYEALQRCAPWRGRGVGDRRAMGAARAA